MLFFVYFFISKHGYLQQCSFYCLLFRLFDLFLRIKNSSLSVSFSFGIFQNFREIIQFSCGEFSNAGQFLLRNRFTQQRYVFMLLLLQKKTSSAICISNKTNHGWWFINSNGIQGAQNSRMQFLFVHEEFRKTDKNAASPVAVMPGNYMEWIFSHISRDSNNQAEIIMIVTTFQSSFHLAHYQVSRQNLHLNF